MDQQTQRIKLPKKVTGLHILDEIVKDTHEVIRKRKSTLPFESLRAMVEASHSQTNSLSDRLIHQRPHIIAEFKRKSPSRPNINMTADPLEIAESYLAGGASAMSILTEPVHFSGSPEDLSRIRQVIDLPLLRKDFIIDPYQIYEARHIGADLILLIGRILNETQIREFTALAHELGLEVLFEIHNLDELKPLGDTPIDFLGVNCRDLTKFQTNLQLLLEIVSDLPSNIPLVAESGIAGPKDVRRLFQAGYQLFLVGEYLMSSDQPANRLADLWQ